MLGVQAALLASAGHDVVVLAGRGACQVIPELDSRHPEVEAVTRQLAAGGAGGELFDRLADRIAEALATALEGRDLVIVHNVMTMPFNLPLAHALVATRHKLLAWTHDLAWTNNRHRDFQRRGGPLDLLATAQPRTRYVAISRLRQAELGRVLGLAEQQVPIVPNGIDVGAFLGISDDTRRLARDGGFDQADPLVLVPARVTRRKSLEIAIRAAALLMAELPGLRLVVSGPLGPHSADNHAYAADLDALVRELGADGVVRFLYRLPKRGGTHPVDEMTMSELYRLADVALMTSEAEGFGLPVLEAGLLRLPLVCPDIPVLAELGSGATWTFPAGSAQGAARAVRQALESPPAVQRRRVVRQYSWPAVLELTEHAIGAALDPG